ncbi:MAG TPA: alpha/beta fold hydrolase [Candidatus Dormibacteraeota bacterium]
MTGQGPPVVLLHSGLSDSGSWDAVVPALAVGHQVIRYDARGYGRSPDPTGEFDLLEDLASVMEAAGVESAHLVGNSMGAGVARFTAVERPELVRSLTLVGPGYSQPPPPPESVARIERWRSARSAGEVEVALQLAAELFFGEEAQLARARRVLERQRPDAPTPRPPSDAARQVEKIRAPTLIVSGAQDDAWILGCSRRLAELIPGARLVLIEGARHHPQEDRPDEFTAALLDFLGGLP